MGEEEVQRFFDSNGVEIKMIYFCIFLNYWNFHLIFVF